MKTSFGFLAALRLYGLRGFIYNSIIPILISLVICYVTYISASNVLDQLERTVNIALMIVPPLAGIALAAYALLLAYIGNSQTIQAILEKDEGKDLIQKMNGGFASTLFIYAIALLTFLVVACIIPLEISSSHAIVIDYLTLFIVLYLLVYTIWVVLGMVLDVFNTAQASTFKS